MTISRDLIRQIRALDAYDLRRLQILIGGLTGDGVPAAQPPPKAGKVSYRQQFVSCGKKTCRRCPHGPYWYAHWRQGGRMRSRYVGKDLPGTDPQAPD